MRTAALVLVDIALVLALSRVLRGVLERLRQPGVMAEVLAGILLGASVLGALPGDPSTALFTADVRAVLVVLGEIAVVAYLFGVGARLDAGALRREGRAVALVGIGSFAVPFLAGTALALVIHDGVTSEPPLVPFALFLGTALAVTAFPVLSRIVDARGLADRPAGRIALAAAAGQELLVWPALAVAVALAGDGSAPEPGRLAVTGVAALAATAILARVVLPAVAMRRPRRAGLAAVAGLAASALGTEAAGLHLVVGAFLFGALLPRAPRDAALAVLRARPAAVASALLLPLFFALPALRVDVGALGADGLTLLALVLAVAVAAKLGSAVLAARLAGLARADAFTVGALMNARGLVELVVLAVGLDAGLIDARLFTVMVLMALATTFATGPAIDLVARAGRRRRSAEPLAA